MTITFAPATKTQAKLRMAIVGGPGTGKTFSALAIGRALVGPAGRIALIDTEHGSASKYAGDPFTFDTVSLGSFDPRIGAEAIKAAEAAGYDLIIVDSLSHFWMGKDGALEQVDRRSQGNKFTAWREVTPMQTALIEGILQSSAHVIFTMRSKVEYVVEVNEKGKSVPRKVGLAPIQREGIEFEADVVGEVDQDHNLRITKTRCRALTDQVISKPGDELGKQLAAWLSSGAPAPEPPAAMTPDTRFTVEAVLVTAKTHSPERYNATAIRLRDAGYRNLSDFYARGSESEGQQVLAELAAPAEETKAEQQVLA